MYQTVTFEGPPKMDQVLWPRHCVQESWGAELHKDLKIHPKKHIIYKGVNPNVDSYSAFFDNAKLGKTCLADLLKEEGVTDVFVCGIATDVCVGKYLETQNIVKVYAKNLSSCVSGYCLSVSHFTL